MTRIMALDVGDKRTGVALSDPTQLLARTLTVISHREEKHDVSAVAALIAEHGVEKVVLGYPRHLSGDIGEQAKRVEAFAEALREELQSRNLQVEIVFWDERYSTVEAERIMRETGRAERKQRRRAGASARVDAIAAAVILQEYLDAHRKPDL